MLSLSTALTIALHGAHLDSAHAVPNRFRVFQWCSELCGTLAISTAPQMTLSQSTCQAIPVCACTLYASSASTLPCSFCVPSPQPTVLQSPRDTFSFGSMSC